jgi:osmotically-inducible protein OsmY
MKSDIQLREDVLAELHWDPEVEETKIGVAVTDGAITLSGHVPTYAQRTAAKRAVARVAGVHAIVDNIEVCLDARHRASDEGLAERIAHVLTWNISAPADVKAEVKNGVVTLTGKLDRHYQRVNILRNIEHVSGVISVIDNMTLKSHVSTAGVQQRIAEALRRHVDVEASGVKITASDGTVTLTGKVDSYGDRNRVEDAAWAAPGVIRVIDRLTIN